MNREVNVTCETAVEPAVPTKKLHIAQDEFFVLRQDGRQNEGGAFPDNGDTGTEAAKCQREISRIAGRAGYPSVCRLPHKLARSCKIDTIPCKTHLYVNWLFL